MFTPSYTHFPTKVNRKNRSQISVFFILEFRGFSPRSENHFTRKGRGLPQAHHDEDEEVEF